MGITEFRHVCLILFAQFFYTLQNINFFSVYSSSLKIEHAHVILDKMIYPNAEDQFIYLVSLNFQISKDLSINTLMAQRGYVGLTNQGATCYLNSLFQTLYFTNTYRKSVYQIPTEGDDPSSSIALALQRLFYNLQFSTTAVSTEELTRSFGWDSSDSFMQHDVQEFNRLLQDKLENKMKNTPAEDSIRKLFVGKMKSYIRCVDVDYESSVHEEFYDIQLNVKGCANLEESFRDYIKEELMDGDNQYKADGYGLQNAKKGVIFEEFPPVLHLQLKRFEYDMMRDSMVKINDKYEFPLEIDLRPYLSPECTKKASYKYRLHGVLVHMGDLSGGHYYVFVRPTKENQWFKFDDDSVTPATLHEVLDGTFGGSKSDSNISSNAYMLVYIKASSVNSVLSQVTVDDIPSHVVEHIKSEQYVVNKSLKRKQDQHLYMKVYVVTDDTFRMNKGHDFIAVDESEVNEETPFHVVFYRRNSKFKQFQEEMAYRLGLPEDKIRFWIISNRKNETVRVDCLIQGKEMEEDIEKVQAKHILYYPHLRLYMEKTTADNNLPTDISNQVFIFIKTFDVFTQEIQSIGSIYLDINKTFEEMNDDFNAQAGYPDDTQLQVYEEITALQVNFLNPHITPLEAGLKHGDIICIEKQINTLELDIINEKNLYVNVANYLNSLPSRILVTFMPKEHDSGLNETTLPLQANMSYMDIAGRVGRELNEDPNRICFFIPDKQGNLISMAKYESAMTLNDLVILSPTNHPLKVYFSILPFAIDQLPNHCYVNVNVCIPTFSHITKKEILIPKSASINDIKERIISFTNQKTIHMYGVTDKQYYRRLPLDQSVNYLEGGVVLYAEPYDDEEQEKNFDDEFATAHYYHNGHKIVFRFRVINGELFENSKKRLAKRLGTKLNLVEYTVIRKHKTIVMKDDSSKLSDFMFSLDDVLSIRDTNAPIVHSKLFIKD
ncbi:hypothetical protein BDB01DRAFT_795070 [Pilobolus umbonatus]|nr:hypothetical protein BDB01DRAFT_795070 [Pilobolus umbonatus]